MNTLERVIIAVGVGAMVLVAGAQSYKDGQRHPDQKIWMKVSDGVSLATERQQVGYDKGFEACQEQF